MTANCCLRDLCKRINQICSNSNEKIQGALHPDRNTYEQLSEISRSTELMVMRVREALICCHDNLQELGELPKLYSMEAPPGVEIQIEPPRVRLVMDGMLPYPLKGGVHFLHDKLDDVLLRHFNEHRIPRPLLKERSAVVFVHRYSGAGIRHLRDYDNVEHRCITNVIARYFLLDDTPASYVSMDILAPGVRNQTEILIMPIAEFQAFAASDQIRYLPKDLH